MKNLMFILMVISVLFGRLSAAMRGEIKNNENSLA